MPRSCTSTARWSWRPASASSRLIVDLVQTGSTLRANGLVETEVIAQVTSRLIVNRTALKTRPEEIGALDRPLPRTRSAARMKRLSTADAGFEADFTALLAQARETPDNVVDGGGRDHRRRARPRRRGALRLHRALRPADADARARCASAPTRSTRPSPTSRPTLLTRWTWPPTRIEAFHRAQMPADLRMTDAAGLTLGMRWTPLDAVGLYVPGGKAAYPSSVLMNAIPARVAGRRADRHVRADARTACSTRWCWRRRGAPGVTEIYRIGGAQAVAALA